MSLLGTLFYFIMASHDARTTYYKRLGWPYQGDPLEQKCKKCGDPTLHTEQGWYTRDCKPVMIPDQWQTSPCISSSVYTPLPDELTDDDVTLMKPWDEREELEDYYCATCTENENV